MRMSLKEYETLLDAARAMKSSDHVIPMNRYGQRLSSITPCCVLYIACGEDGLVAVNEQMAVVYIKTDPEDEALQTKLDEAWTENFSYDPVTGRIDIEALDRAEAKVREEHGKN